MAFWMDIPLKELGLELVKSCLNTWEILPYMAVLKVSIQLQTLAVLWTLFCVDRIADLSSFMDTFSMLKKLPDLGSFMNTFPTQYAKTTNTADHSIIMDTFWLLELIFISSVHKTAGPWQFYGHIEKLVDLGTSMDTEFQVSQNCWGPQFLWFWPTGLEKRP